MKSSAAEIRRRTTPHRRTRVKVCGVATTEEARLADRHGADAPGLVSAMPGGPGPIPEALISEIATTVPPPVTTLLLTSETADGAVTDQQRRCRANTLQLVGRLEHGTYADLRGGQEVLAPRAAAGPPVGPAPVPGGLTACPP